MNKLDMKPIDEALKTHYAEKSLSDSQLDQLMAMQTAATEAQSLTQPEPLTKETSGAKRLFRWFLPDFRYAFYATACLLVVVCFAVTFNLINQPPLSQRIMDEIAYNHRQDMPIEVASSSREDIRQYLDKLSFPIISPIALGKPNWKFLGGRYCSINGKLAAQLKLKNLADNTVYTLYQAATEGGAESSDTTRLTEIIDGIGFSIWREKGLLLGLASSP